MAVPSNAVSSGGVNTVDAEYAAALHVQMNSDRADSVDGDTTSVHGDQGMEGMEEEDA